MPLSLAESQAINSIAAHLTDFLPGTPHPYANQSISFAGVAQNTGLSQLWTGGSKLSAITTLLEKTLETHRSSFCQLISEIVRKGLVYRTNKREPITREEIQALNELITRVHFKIPELWDPLFLDTLPTVFHDEGGKHDEKAPLGQADLDQLKGKLLKMGEIEPRSRGLAFEGFLEQLFALFGMDPRGAFRLAGEQIDGSCQIGTDTYLIEAKWHKEEIGQADLLVLRGKVESKSSWSRGLFISCSGFTQQGLTAFARSRSTNVIGMNGQDMHFILEGEMSLRDVISRKARRAAETGEFFVPLYQLIREEP